MLSLATALVYISNARHQVVAAWRPPLLLPLYRPSSTCVVPAMRHHETFGRKYLHDTVTIHGHGLQIRFGSIEVVFYAIFLQKRLILIEALRAGNFIFQD